LYWVALSVRVMASLFPFRGAGRKTTFRGSSVMDLNIRKPGCTFYAPVDFRPLRRCASKTSLTGSSLIGLTVFLGVAFVAVKQALRSSHASLKFVKSHIPPHSHDYNGGTVQYRIVSVCLIYPRSMKKIKPISHRPQNCSDRDFLIHEYGE
jgi:hypothetical protein